MNKISVKALTYTYSKSSPFEKTAINDISFDVCCGEFIGIIGHTGSGKSTLVQHLNGLLKPESGSVYIDGEDIFADEKKLKNIRRKVGLVFQYPEYQLFEETVFKDVAFGPSNIGLVGKELERAVLEAMNFVGLDDELLTKSPFELSGGQKRRAAIAGVIAMRPDVLILDEPTAGLDPSGRDDILSHIKEYHRETGGVVMLVSHSMEDIAKYADKVLVLNKGRLEMFGTMQEVFGRAKHLQEIGLSIPQITKVVIALKEKGIDLGSNAYTVEQAVSLICEYAERRRKG